MYAEEKGFGAKALLALNGSYWDPQIYIGGPMVKQAVLTTPVESGVEISSISTAYEVEVLPADSAPEIPPVTAAPAVEPCIANSSASNRNHSSRGRSYRPVVHPCHGGFRPNG
jgi:hypothetical protein